MAGFNAPGAFFVRFLIHNKFDRTTKFLETKSESFLCIDVMFEHPLKANGDLRKFQMTNCSFHPCSPQTVKDCLILNHCFLLVSDCFQRMN